MTQYVKPRAYGEPISMDAPGFNPTVHKDLVIEVNDALTAFAEKRLVGPADADSNQYDYRMNQSSVIEYYDRTLHAWRPLAVFTDDYRPAWKQEAQYVNNTLGNRDFSLETKITTDKALSNGADIRVYKKNTDGTVGEQIPSYVPSVVPNTGSLKDYYVRWIYSLSAGETINIIITYGDPKASLPKLTYPELERLRRSTGVGDVMENVTVFQDTSQGWKPDDYVNFGVQLYGNRDDVGSSHTIPSGVVLWNGQPYSSVGLNSNGAIEFGSASNGRPTGAPNAITWGGNGDLYEKYIRFGAMPDGYAWIVDTGTSGYAGGMKLAIRYYNTGRWTMTMFNNTSTWPNQMQIKVNGVTKTYVATQVPKENDPTSWFVLDVTGGKVVTTSTGTEVEVLGARVPGETGLRPMFASSIPSRSGSVQEVLDYLESRINVPLQVRRQMHTLTTASLAPSTSEIIALDTLGSFDAVTISTSTPARVRAYSTQALANADKSRSLEMEPSTMSGCLMEVITTSSALTVPLGPVAKLIGSNSSIVSITIDNLDTVDRAVTVTMEGITTDL